MSDEGSTMTPTIAAVVLSMGNRPDELATALATLRDQARVDVDCVVVGNGWEPEGLPAWVRTVHLPENVGIPEGRNVGAREARGEYVFFYDDDASLPTSDVLARMAAVLAADPAVAVVQPRGADPYGRPTPRRWVPRLRVGPDARGGEAAVFWEALCMIRRTAFDEVGGWPGHFFYGHEGVDIAMRLLDAGWRIRYEPSVVVHHPATAATRHAVFYRMNARNRVWVARRNLPAPLIPLYLGVWTLATVVRVRRPGPLAVWFRGFVEGWRTDAGERRPMSWRTAWRMTRLGRPPIV
ncbi:glycosyltransferase family 2 protein [Propionicicella superfundia]|uniref:glycosyltransferase family 2 protein n=1 Tax=Propionicicella superfundia TaxID=348582 RepID=UPI00042835ED|nr:glycosyltransferase family 2 protein [Propionicicella superfundia]